jgi:rhodanese-related sulfurtransferase
MGFFSKWFGSNVTKLTAMELSEKLKFGKHPLVIDVRKPEEFRLAHIAGAKLIPLGEFRKHMKDLPKAREIVCVCASGNRSAAAARALAKEGFIVFDLQGGMNAWRHAKLPVQKG